MKKLVLSMVAIILVTCIITLCGCETTVNLVENTTLSGNMSETYEEPTLIVDVTDENGEVVSTATVTMSAQDKEEEKNFFAPIKKPNISTSVSQDRVQQAIQNQQALENLSTTKPAEDDAPDINNENSNQTTTQKPNSKPNIPYIQDDAAVLRSNQYMINVRLVDSQGVAQNYKIAKNGKRSSVSMVYNDVPLALILGEETWYLLSVDEKIYVEIPKSQIEEGTDDEEFLAMVKGDPFDFNKTMVSESTVTEDGITYRVVEYDDGNKDYFIGKTIIKTTAEDNTVMYYDSVSPIAPASLFTPPADFTKTNVTDDKVSDMVEDLDPNAVAEPHSHEDE